MLSRRKFLTAAGLGIGAVTATGVGLTSLPTEIPKPVIGLIAVSLSKRERKAGEVVAEEMTFPCTPLHADTDLRPFGVPYHSGQPVRVWALMVDGCGEAVRLYNQPYFRQFAKEAIKEFPDALEIRVRIGDYDAQYVRTTGSIIRWWKIPRSHPYWLERKWIKDENKWSEIVFREKAAIIGMFLKETS